MKIKITDPQLLEELRRAGDTAEFVGPDDQPLGQFVAKYPHDLPPGFVLPYTDEEIDEMRKDLTGVSFEEMWEEIRAKERK